jgi:hypothetical protein
MNNLINEITSIYKNKKYEPKYEWSANRFKRQMINSVLIVGVVIVFITAVMIISAVYTAFSSIF